MLLYSCREEKQRRHESEEGKEQTKEVMKMSLFSPLINIDAGFNLMQHAMSPFSHQITDHSF